MVFAYKCNGVFTYITADKKRKSIDCPCGETHELIETTFDDIPGFPNVVPDTLPQSMDWGAGRKFATRTERKRYYKENGLRRVSRKEQRRNMDCTGREPLGPISYAGQKRHTSRVNTTLE